MRSWKITETIGFSILNPTAVMKIFGPADELRKLADYLDKEKKNETPKISRICIKA